VSDRLPYAPTFGVEHVEDEHQEMDDTERLAPAPPPHPQPSSPYRGHGIDSRP